MNPKIKKEIIRYSMMVLACVIYALGFCFFIEPNNIVAGAMSGLAQVVNHFIPQIQVGIWLLILNTPIIIISFFQEGFKFTINCLITIATLSLITTGLDLIIEHYNLYLNVDILTACIFGAVLQGISIGIYCKYRVSSGGTELIGRFIYEWTNKKFSIPLMNGICDGVIVLAGVITFRNPTNFLYALIIIFIVTKVSDTILVGLNKSKICYIITEKGEDIGHFLVNNSPRGVTLLKGKGMYTDKEKMILLTVVKKTQITQLKEWVKELDPNAFMIVGETNEVLGNGFKQLNVDEND